MPAQRPAAVFEPIPPDLDLDALVEQTDNFQYVTRIPAEVIDSEGQETFEKMVILHVILGGKPLVIEGFQNRLDQWTFSTQWLKDNLGSKYEQARFLNKQENLTLSMNHYLDNLPKLANQFTKFTYTDPKRQRLYLKDIDCPQLWHDKLKEAIPPAVFYLNECIGDIGGPGSADERNPNAMGTRQGRGIARAGDLMSSLPPTMRAENMMCYIGHEGTYTPAHREMCASLGQNIMVEASGTMGEDGRPTKPGSSVWFMTESKDRHLVSEYWLSNLGHDIEVEAHFAQINAWKKAPFTVYVVEQKVGDFLLIPPLAPHQVWNRGTRTMKAAWNRTTIETLEMAIDEALPRARMVCRDEQYKVKATVLFTLNRYSALLRHIDYQRGIATDEKTLRDLRKGAKIRQLQKDFKRLFALYRTILLSESFSAQSPEKKVEYVPYDSNVTCSYCRCNIFNRFLTCKSCIVPLENDEEDTYDICLECYAIGRSCRCLSKLSWVEQFPWKDLVEKYDLWRTQIIHVDGGTDSTSPLSIDGERERYGQKTLAQVCQEQLKARPFRDPTKPAPVEELDDDPEEDDTNADGTLKKKPKKKRSEKWYREHLPCHICSHREVLWKLAVCGGCNAAYCYGSLWRGFDIMPRTVMENLSWKCPRCLKICNCNACRKDPKNKPYEPSGTVLGHDTRKFADPRSVESLVDFSSSNMHWLKKAGDDHPTDTRRMDRRKTEAENAKSQGTSLSEHYVDEAYEEQAESEGRLEIDPKLLGLESPDASPTSSPPDGNDAGENAMRQAAANALSRLEQDPEGFMAEAGISGVDGAIDPRILETNGSDYNHLESSSGRFKLPQLSQQQDEQTPPAKKKRSRKSDYRAKVQNDAALLGNDANRRFYTSQVQNSIVEAKKTGRLIAAKAAITGDSLVLKLQIGSSKLAGVKGTNEPRFTSDVADDSLESNMIVQSDVPTVAPIVTTHGKTVQPPKKRVREEIDDDFQARKRRDRKADSSKNKPTTRKVEESSESDFDIEADYNDQERGGQNGKPKRRSLPAYLARRSPVNDLKLPKELTNVERRRSQPQPKVQPGAESQSSREASASDSSSAPAPAAFSRPVAALAPAAVKANTHKARPAPKPHGLGPREAVMETPRAIVDDAELNRRAKLRAMAGNISETESSSESEDSLIAPDPPKQSRREIPTKIQLVSASPPTPKAVRARPKKAQIPAPAPVVLTSTPSEPKAPSERRSIFSNGRRGKVKITSARTRSGVTK